jgi:hypothetical protein
LDVATLAFSHSLHADSIHTVFPEGRIFALAALTLLGSLPARAQLPGNIRSLSIDAHETGTVSTFDILWQTDWGSYDRDNHQAKKLLVSVHDMSRKIPLVDVEIFFIARNVGNGKWLIYKRADIPVEMKGLIEVKGYVQSPLIKLNEQNYAALGQQYASGLQMIGWVVRGKFNGQIFQVRASDQTLLEIAQANPRQPITLEALIAEYEKANHPKR